MLAVNSASNTQIAVDLWNCQTEVIPVTYVRAPLGSCFKRRSDWTPLIEKARARLGTWRRKYLSKGGRFVLLKSTLSSLPIFLFSVFTTHIFVIRELETISHNFLWGSEADAKKYSLVNWQEVCQPKLGLSMNRILSVSDSNPNPKNRILSDISDFGFGFG